MNVDIEVSATRLAIKFSDPLIVPKKYKQETVEKSNRSIRRNLSKTEILFRKDVQKWEYVIETILNVNHIGVKQGWRFINLAPKVKNSIEHVTDCEDFMDFYHYLIMRKENIDCSHDEIGKLCMLHTAFQREVENIIKSFSDIQSVSKSETGIDKPTIIAFDVPGADYDQNKEFLDKADALLEKDN